MLGLKLPTDPRWVHLAEMSIEEILIDHAYCEQKAATNCIGLIQLYPDKPYLVDRLTPVVIEEWTHFKMVLDELKKRNMSLGYQRKDKYVGELMTFMRKGGRSDDRFLDKMLMSAMIEARSCERFRLLSEGISDPDLKDFYHKLMIAEALHYSMFIDIAVKYIDKEIVKKRWEEWLEFEASVMKNLEVRGDRVH
ncbi:MAG TPA: tRNA-(ms[2]io[6]A)-hydroxylase [Chitinophagales bacterium]|nr:tRNA-(ms[2]io[6]A)-hydroxylase [Chitinophagales bacterium]